MKRSIVVGLVACVAAISACGSSGHRATSAPNAAASSGTVRSASQAASGAVASGGPVSISGLPPSWHPTVTDAGAASAPGPDVAFGSHVYAVGPGGTLPSPARASIALGSPLTSGTPVAVATRASASEAWTYLPASLAADGRSVSFSLTSLGEFAVLRIDSSRALPAFTAAFGTHADGGLTQGVATPRCPAEQQARADGYQVSATSGDALRWCLGIQNGHRVLNVVGNRQVPLQLVHSDLDVISNDYGHMALDSLRQLSADGAAIVAPEGTIAFNADLGPGGSESLSTTLNARGQSLYALQVTLAALDGVLPNLDGDAGPSAIAALNTVLANGSCAQQGLTGTSATLLANCLTPAVLRTAFGASGALLFALVNSAPAASYLNTAWATLRTQFDSHDQYQITVRRTQPAVTLAAFAGDWEGHTRDLKITGNRAVETVSSGCCWPMINVAFTLSDPRGTPSNASVTAVVTSVQVYPEWSTAGLGPAPKVGQIYPLTINNGVIVSPVSKATYCDAAQEAKGTCGA